LSILFKKVGYPNVVSVPRASKAMQTLYFEYLLINGINNHTEKNLKEYEYKNMNAFFC